MRCLSRLNLLTVLLLSGLAVACGPPPEPDETDMRIPSSPMRQLLSGSEFSRDRIEMVEAARSQYEGLAQAADLSALEHLGDAFWSGEAPFAVNRAVAARFYARALVMDEADQVQQDRFRARLDELTSGEWQQAAEQEARQIDAGLSVDAALAVHADGQEAGTINALTALVRAAIDARGNYQPQGVEIPDS